MSRAAVETGGISAAHCLLVMHALLRDPKAHHGQLRALKHHQQVSAASETLKAQGHFHRARAAALCGAEQHEEDTYPHRCAVSIGRGAAMLAPTALQTKAAAR